MRVVVLLNLDTELVEKAREDVGSLPVTLQSVTGARGWGASMKAPPDLLVVGSDEDAPVWVSELKTRDGFGKTPVICVMPTLQAALVPRLRDAGVVRIMMRDEFAMDVGTILRAVA